MNLNLAMIRNMSSGKPRIKRRAKYGRRLVFGQSGFIPSWRRDFFGGFFFDENL